MVDKRVLINFSEAQYEAVAEAANKSALSFNAFVRMASYMAASKAGVEVAKQVFKIIDSLLRIEQFLFDGKEVYSGDKVFIIEGKIHSIRISQAPSLIPNNIGYGQCSLSIN